MELTLSAEQPLYKRIVNFKEKQREGLMVCINTKETHRFMINCFDPTGHLLVLCDIEGSMYAVDFLAKKSWTVTTEVRSCTVCAFSPFVDSAILAGTKCGLISIFNVQSGTVMAKLKGHKKPVKSITFARDFLCLSASKAEAVLWNLETNTKLQILNLKNSTSLKHAYFMPVSCDIFTLFDDQIVHIWNFHDFELGKQLEPKIWNNYVIKSVAFTLDGKTMVFGFDCPLLALFLTKNVHLLKLITLPDSVQSVKHLKFISTPNDGGANKNLIILSQPGLVYFYGLDEGRIVHDLQTKDTVLRIDCSPKSNLVACVTSPGSVQVYDVTQFSLGVQTKTSALSIKRRCCKKYSVAERNMKEVLDKDKLKSILNGYGEYPDSYRIKIWEQLLDLPKNREEYNAIINNRTIDSFPDLSVKYPLESKRSLKNLQKLLDNLVTWSAFFLHVDYLPVFVFPFVKVFYDKPLICFEAVCTILVNWCQHWFEYFPLPPVNILAMIENLLLEHDPELLKHFAFHQIPSTIYAWPLLESNFSEILTATAWKVFWDHVLTNEPSFILCATAAYSILHRQSILNLIVEQQFKMFFYTHHAMDVRKLIAKTYHILYNTQAANHPRQYLKDFARIEAGAYPNFSGYSKTLMELHDMHQKSVNEQMEKIRMEQEEMLQQRKVDLEVLEAMRLKQEENTRVLEMENALLRKVTCEQEQLRRFQKRLAVLHGKFHQENEVIADLKQKYYLKQQQDFSKGDYPHLNREEQIKAHYSTDATTKTSSTSEMGNNMRTAKSISVIKKYEPEQWTKDESRFHLTLNMFKSIVAVENLVDQIETELKDQTSEETVVMKLEGEAKYLAEEIDKLLGGVTKIEKSETTNIGGDSKTNVSINNINKNK